LAAETTPGMNYESPAGGGEVPSPEPNVDSWQRWEEKWALDGIDSRLNGTGTAMRSFPASVRGLQISRNDLFLLVKGIGKNAPVLLRRFDSDWLGAPFLPALALLGALRRPWRGPQALSRLFFMLIAGVPLVANPFAITDAPRYSFIFVPLLSIWAANGLFELGLWTKASAAAAGWRVLARPIVSQCVIPGLIGLAIIISSAKGVRRLGEFTDSAPPRRVDKELGLWIGHQQKHPVRIMDIELPLAYHAGAQFSQFPYCTGELALRYLDAVKVDYIVLRRGESFTKCYAEWKTQGIPDSRAELVHVSPRADAEFVVYRWHWENSPLSKR
jgi:hypothetical protein